MKKVFISLALALSFFVFSSCSDDDDTVEPTKNGKTVVFITDFEKGSPFALNLLGAIENHFPEASVEFITSKPWDVFEAGYLLEEAASQYPDGTYFVTIVGTGVDDKVIIAENLNSRFICPDNGIISRVAQTKGIGEFYYVENEDYLGGTWSDIPYTQFYINAIKALLEDKAASSFGAKAEPVSIEMISPAIESGAVKGQALFRDNFGNLTTNIPDSLMKAAFSQGDLLKISSADKVFFASYGTYYNSVPVGQNVCFANTNDYLEMAVNYGDFSGRYSIVAGAALTIEKATVKIGVLSFNASSVAEDVRLGMKSKLDSLGFISGENVEYIFKSADGNFSRLNSLVAEIEAENPDFVVSISTPASQAAAAILDAKIPLVFTYVTDPQSAGLLDGRKNMTGLSDRTNFSEYLDFVSELLPDLTKAGAVYNSNEANSVYAKSQFEKYDNFYAFDFIYAEAASAGDLPSAYSELKTGGVEAVLVAANNSASAGMNNLASLCSADNIPLVGDSFEHAKDGALAAISIDYDDLASATGETVASLIRGVSADDTAVQYFHTNVVALNKTAAAAIGFDFSENMLEKAAYIYE